MEDVVEVRRRIGASVRAEAARRGLRQLDIGLRLGVSQSAVSGRFVGRLPFSAEELVELADWFDVPVARFFEPLPGARPVGEVG